MAGDTKRTEDYSNLASMPIRTRMAVLVLLMVVKILEPWNYAHQFEGELKALQDLLLGREIK